MDNGHLTDDSHDDGEATKAAENGFESATSDSEAEPVTAAKAEESDEEPAAFSAGRALRSIETQTELFDRLTGAAEAEDDAPGPRFPMRRAVSDWAVIDRGPHAVHIRSERIRRTAQMFDELTWAEEARRAAEEGRRSGRPFRAAAPALAAPPLTEREVQLVLLPAPPPDQSRGVDAILALGSGRASAARHPTDSDAEGDETDEDRLWEKVRAKIAARRNKFRRMESGQHGPEPIPTATAKHNPKRLSADRTGWSTDAKKVEPPSARQVALSSTRQMAEQQASPPVTKQAAVNTAQHAAESHDQEATRSWSGKYIEQNEEQTVLRSLGSAVLAKQKLAAKQKVRGRLASESSEAERRKKKVENQRTDAQNKLEKVKGRLTRDSAFEKRGLEELLVRLDRTIRDETRTIAKISKQMAETDASMEELRRRAAT